jgi:ABC-type Fe3+ transport system substrate-binding protein
MAATRRSADPRLAKPARSSFGANVAWRVRVLHVVFGFIFLSCGCADQAASPIRLLVISPHRDEIREEVAQAFRPWFEGRTQTRHARACTALQDYLRDEKNDPAAAAKAVTALVDDWSPADRAPLLDSLDKWHHQPSPATGTLLLDALKRWHPWDRPVEIVWQDIGGGTSAIARYVRARFREMPDGIGIDLLFGGGTDIYLRFADEGLLLPLSLDHLIRGRIRPTLNGVPLYDPQGRWFGPVLSSFGILCNREVLRRIGYPGLPRTWDDLGHPALGGWVGAGDPRLTGSVHMVYEIVLQGEGWDAGIRKLLRLGANAHSFIRDSGTLTRVVVTGEVAAAGNIDVNALSAVGRNPEMMVFILPDAQRRTLPDGKEVHTGGTIINPDAIAVLKGAPRAELARAFVEFTLSDAGQQLFMLRPGVPGGPRRYPLCRLSVVEAMYQRYSPQERSIGEANPFQQTNTLPYNSKLGEQRWDALNDLLGAVVVDAHEELAATRKALALLPSAERDRLAAELYAPPCSEAELAAHARRIVDQGPRARAAQINEWAEQARARYRRVRAEAGQIGQYGNR